MPPRLTIICATYKQKESLLTLIYSLLSQTYNDFIIDIIHDGPDQQFKVTSDELLRSYSHSLRMSHSERRFNDYGHSLRDIGLRRCTTDFVMITNGDNYYCPIFLEEMFKKIDDDGLDLALCDMVHSHNRPGGRDQGRYKPFVTFPQHYHIDIGAFIVRTQIARTVGFTDRSHDADGVFMDQIMAWNGRSVRWGKVDKILLVHN